MDSCSFSENQRVIISFYDTAIESNFVSTFFFSEGISLKIDSIFLSSADVYLKRSTDRIGHIYKKTSYFQYTDATFTNEMIKRPLLGILGPTIHGEVGDTLVVKYFNQASNVFSVHPHGLFYLKDGEGKSALSFLLPGFDISWLETNSKGVKNTYNKVSAVVVLEIRLQLSAMLSE